MTDAAADPAHDGQPTVEQSALAADALASDPTDPDEPLAAAASTPPAAVPVPPPTAGERPEIAVGAAFAGGLALALLLKRLARR